MDIEILWSDGCPNHEATRRDLERVLASRGLDPSIVRSVRVDETNLERVRFPGSPTVRVDGLDIEPGFKDPRGYSLGCRVYTSRGRMRGQPEVAWIAQAVDRALSRTAEPGARA